MHDPQSKTGIEVTDPKAYIATILDALDGLDPLDAYAATPGELGRRITANPAEVLRRRPYPDRWTWTPLEVIGHLLDVEWVLGCRTRAVLSEDSPTVIGFGQDDWVEVLKHNERDPAGLLEDFAALRTINLRFWRGIPHESLGRVGVHNERGPESLGNMLRLYAGHDRYHLQQFDRYIKAMI